MKSYIVCVHTRKVIHPFMLFIPFTLNYAWIGWRFEGAQRFCSTVCLWKWNRIRNWNWIKNRIPIQKVNITFDRFLLSLCDAGLMFSRNFPFIRIKHSIVCVALDYLFECLFCMHIEYALLLSLLPNYKSFISFYFQHKSIFRMIFSFAQMLKSQCSQLCVPKEMSNWQSWSSFNYYGSISQCSHFFVSVWINQYCVVLVFKSMFL